MIIIIVKALDSYIYGYMKTLIYAQQRVCCVAVMCHY